MLFNIGLEIAVGYEFSAVAAASPIYDATISGSNDGTEIIDSVFTASQVTVADYSGGGTGLVPDDYVAVLSFPSVNTASACSQATLTLPVTETTSGTFRVRATDNLTLLTNAPSTGNMPITNLVNFVGTPVTGVDTGTGTKELDVLSLVNAIIASGNWASGRRIVFVINATSALSECVITNNAARLTLVS